MNLTTMTTSPISPCAVQGGGTLTSTQQEREAVVTRLGDHSGSENTAQSESIFIGLMIIGVTAAS